MAFLMLLALLLPDLLMLWGQFAAYLLPGFAPRERTTRLVLRECWLWVRFHKLRMLRALLGMSR